MNSLCLEPEITRDAPAASAASRVGGIAAVRAIRPQSALLACIESIARDRKMSVSQQALLQRFPRRCRRFQADEGRIEYRDALDLMADLGLADSFETVRELPALADLGDRVTRGVILCVPESKGAGPRWWRLAAVRSDGLVAMQPETEDPSSLVHLAWPEIERLGAIAVALD